MRGRVLKSVWSAREDTSVNMLAMSTLMMPAATMTTMTNPGPIPVAQPAKLEPKFVLNHNAAAAAAAATATTVINKAGTYTARFGIKYS